MVEFQTSGGTLEIGHKEKENAKLNLQVADLFNLSTVNASYMDSVDLPKIDVNTALLKGLGLVGDTSRIPYQKVPIKVKYHGVDVIKEGWLIVKETSDSYKVTVIDGIIDFFKAIEGRKMGTDLDLSEIAHEKTAQTVADSQDNDLYRYLLADYGGKMITASGKINVDYLTPSIKVPYLLNKIEEFTGYKFTGPILLDPDVKDLWLTYPKAPKELGTEIATEHFQALVNPFTKTVIDYTPVTTVHSPGTSWEWTTNPIQGNLGPGRYNLYNPNAYSSSVVTQGTLHMNWKYYIAEPGTYRLNFKLKGKVTALKAYRLNMGGSLHGISYFDGFKVEILVNGTSQGFVQSAASGDEVDVVIYRPFEQDDVVELVYYVDTTRAYSKIKFDHEKTEIKISKTDLGSVDFNDALKDFEITGFFKEFLWRYGIAPVTNNTDKTIYLQTTNDKIKRDNAVNWSDKFVSRVSETYNIPIFGQNNRFTHKYNQENQSYNDGLFTIDNANIDGDKVVIGSKIYSAELEQSQVTINITDYLIPRILVWQSETKESGGVTSTTYKTMSNRFYFTKAKLIEDNIDYESEILSEIESRTNFYMANIQDVHFSSLVPKYYGKHKLLLDVFKKHDIELNISVFDIISLDLGKLYYFEQECQFYILNKLSWQGKKTSKGEFIRVIL